LESKRHLFRVGLEGRSKPRAANAACQRGAEKITTMGAGIAVFEDCSIPWKLLYDEVICVLEGHFHLRVGDEVYECEPGDVLWIPENTEIAYESDGRSVIFYTLYPENWRDLHGIT
jgi:ethanolamine utilization protein EutQ